MKSREPSVFNYRHCKITAAMAARQSLILGNLVFFIPKCDYFG